LAITADGKSQEGDEGFASGPHLLKRIHTIEIVVELIPNLDNFAIGLVLPQNHRPQADILDWSYVSNGNRTVQGRQYPYGDRIVTGGVIGLMLEYPQGVLQFYRNGVNVGVAAHRVPRRVYVSIGMQGSTGRFAIRYPSPEDRAKYIAKSFTSETLRKARGAIFLKDKFVEISPNKKMRFISEYEVKNDEKGHTISTVKCEKILTNGQHYMEFKLLEQECVVGVLPKDATDVQKKWCYYSRNGAFYQSNLRATPTPKNSTIGIELDFTAKTISFWFDTEKIGPVYRDLAGPVQIAVGLKGGASISIVQNL